MMAYMCEKDPNKECDGCGKCIPWGGEEDLDPIPPEPEEPDWDNIPDKWEGERL